MKTKVPDILMGVFFITKCSINNYIFETLQAASDRLGQNAHFDRLAEVHQALPIRN